MEEPSSMRGAADGLAPALVTGAGGLIGRAVVRALAEAGVATRALVRSRSGDDALRRAGVEVRRGTLTEPGAALEGARSVFNFAHDFRATGRANVSDFGKLLDAMADAGARRLVHASSVVVHDGWPQADIDEAAPVTDDPNPDSYRAAKIEMERRIAQAVADGTLETAVILRPTLVYGPGSRFWTVGTVERLRAGTVLLPEAPPDHPAAQPFGLCHCVHVDDVAEAAVRAASRCGPGVHTFLLSEPHPPTWAEFYQLHADILGTGGVRLCPYADLQSRLPPAEDGPSDTGPGLAAKVSAEVRKIIGNETVDAVGAWLRRRRAPSGDQAPDRFLFDLYTSRGRVDLSRAQAELGFAPEKSVRERLQDMAGDLGAVK